MKLSTIKQKKKNTTVYRYSTSYSVLVYQNEEEKEFIWNSTNLIPPFYVYSNFSNEKLLFQGILEGMKNLVEFSPSVGDRYFRYKDPETFVKERKVLARHYWENNYGDCNDRYEDFPEFFVVSCRSMNKARIELAEVEEE